MEHRLLPIGIDDFEKLRRANYYYVDKSLFIRELLDNLTEVILFTRPRRFGKTLMMSMLKAFFEKTEADKRDLFAGLAIERARESYWAHHARYPVIFLTFKRLEANATYELAREALAALMADEAERHPELATSPHLSQSEIDRFIAMTRREGSEIDLRRSLLDLSSMLEKHHGEKTVILIDEYDVPLDQAYLHGYYADMINLIRVFLGNALKTNPGCAFAVLTGCLRISRESIFTGLNNLKVDSILDSRFREYFGFLPADVETVLTRYGGAHRIDDARAWYDGYNFRGAEVYNPWDILNFCDLIKTDPDAEPESFWVNTSGNDFIRRFIATADTYTRADIERLIDGETVTKSIHPEITYGELDLDPNNLWSLLLLTGYLTVAGEVRQRQPLPLRIPNAEIRQIFIEKIKVWFQDRTRTLDLRPLYEAILGGDANTVEQNLRKQLLETISYHDAHENFYHGFLVGLLHGCGEWRISSNREAGYGRGDILLEGYDEARAVVMEIKVAQTPRELEVTCADAIAQIREKAYAVPLVARGFQRIWLFGVAFCGKRCRVVCEELGGVEGLT